MKKRILSLVLCAALLLSLCLFMGAGMAGDATATGTAEDTSEAVGAPTFQSVGPFMTYFPDSAAAQRAPMLRTAAVNDTASGTTSAVEVT